MPVFRQDDGTALEEPWLLAFLTCAAPYAPTIGQPRSRKLLRSRIRRVLAIGRAYGHTALVPGTWGCGAFGNDPRTTAEDFRAALVSPANSFGYMDGGIDLAYTERFGWDLQDRLRGMLSGRHFGELPVGQAVILETLDREYPFLVSAPTRPQMRRTGG